MRKFYFIINKEHVCFLVQHSNIPFKILIIVLIIKFQVFNVTFQVFSVKLKVFILLL